VTCARCEELEEEVAYLRSEMGLQLSAEKFQRLRGRLRLAPGAINFLLVLYQAKGRMVSKLQALDALPSPVRDRDDRNTQLIGVYASHVRRALGHDAISNGWGRGYAMTPAGLARVDQELAA
jgi:DNA-binding response OmpR family regulator